MLLVSDVIKINKQVRGEGNVLRKNLRKLCCSKGEEYKKYDLRRLSKTPFKRAMLYLDIENCKIKLTFT